MEPTERFERPTLWLQIRCSTTELRRQKNLSESVCRLPCQAPTLQPTVFVFKLESRLFTFELYCDELLNWKQNLWRGGDRAQLPFRPTLHWQVVQLVVLSMLWQIILPPRINVDQPRKKSRRDVLGISLGNYPDTSWPTYVHSLSISNPPQKSKPLFSLQSISYSLMLNYTYKLLIQKKIKFLDISKKKE